MAIAGAALWARSLVGADSLSAADRIQAAGKYGEIALSAVVADRGTEIRLVASLNPESGKSLGYCEGPVEDAAGNLWFTEFVTGTSLNRIWELSAKGNLILFHEGPEGSNGLDFAPGGGLVAAQIDRLARYAPNGSATVIAASGNGIAFHNVADLTFSSKGEVFFTNHNTGSQVFFLGLDGKPKALGPFAAPTNGIEWIEESGALYLSLASGTQGRVMKYRPVSDGSLQDGVEFVRINSPHGMALDRAGNLFVADWGAGAIKVFDASGKALGQIIVNSAAPGDANPNGNASNCAFGGPVGQTLFITGDGGVYAVELKVPGRVRPDRIVATGLAAYPHEEIGARTVLDLSARPGLDPIRINCGGKGFQAGNGEKWAADSGYTGGGILNLDHAIKGTGIPDVYRSERWYDPAKPALKYVFSLPAGAYSVRLHFAEIWPTYTVAGKRIFDVTLNGKTVLKDFDISALVGVDSALIREFQVETTGGDFVVGFVNRVEHAKISGIEILALGATGTGGERFRGRVTEKNRKGRIGRMPTGVFPWLGGEAAVRPDGRAISFP